MAEARGGSRWTEKQLHLGATALYNADQQIRKGERWDRDQQKVRAVLDAVFPVGEPDASQKTINGLLDAVERLNDQKDALRRENGQLRELLDLPIAERVEAVAELAGEPDDERLLETVEKALREAVIVEGPEGERAMDFSLDRLARAAVAAVRAAGAKAE